MTDDIDVLRSALASGEAVLAVHYACQSLTEVTDGPASVACVSFYDVRTGAATAYSLANVGDAGTPESEREKLLLAGALKFVRDHAEARWIHWKMSRPEYGFDALEDRCRWIGCEPPGLPPADRRFDLDSLIVQRYGESYAPHPRLPSLVARNGLTTRHARWGAEEPQLLARGEYVAIQQSTTEKVRLLAELLRLMTRGRLQTENSSGEVPFAATYLEAVQVVLSVADRFLFVRRALTRRHGGRPTLILDDEYDAQDLMRALLVQFFDDVRDEEWSPSYAGAASRIDFVLPEVRVAVELKWTRASMTGKSLGDELLVDRERYAKHPNVGHLICLVFDYEGHLPNPRGMEQDLDRKVTGEGLATTVKIIDR